MLRRIKLIFIYSTVIILAVNIVNLSGEDEQAVNNTNNNAPGTVSNANAAGNDDSARFQQFRDMLLKSAPPEKKEELEKELEKLSKNKDFLKQLTPEKMNQVKSEIEVYKKSNSDSYSDVKSSDEPRHALKLNNKNEIAKEGKDLKKKTISFDFPNVSLEEFARFIANLNEKNSYWSKFTPGKCYN